MSYRYETKGYADVVISNVADDVSCEPLQVARCYASWNGEAFAYMAGAWTRELARRSMGYAHEPSRPSPLDAWRINPLGTLTLETLGDPALDGAWLGYFQTGNDAILDAWRRHWLSK